MERPYNYESITILKISFKNLEELPSWVSECKKLDNLNCLFNKITLLNNLPQTLNELYCNNNKITNLNNLPQTLKILNCSSNKLTELDNLPQTLKNLKCYDNSLKYDFEPTLENIRNHSKHNKL